MSDPEKIRALRREIGKKAEEIQVLIDASDFTLAQIDLALEDKHDPRKPFPEEMDPTGQIRRLYDEIRALKIALKKEETGEL